MSFEFESESVSEDHGYMGHQLLKLNLQPGNNKQGSITVPLTSCLTDLESAIMTTDDFCFLFAKQTDPDQSNRRPMVQ